MMETDTIHLWEEDYPSALYPDEFQKPLSIIEKFFQQYRLREVQEGLWNGLALQVTDEIKPSPVQRYELFRLGNELDRLVDAVWLLANGAQEVKRQVNPDVVAWIDSGALSFLSPQKARNPIKYFRKLFKDRKLHEWKTLAIYGRQEALLDPLYWMRSNSMSLREFAEYLGLNELVEAAFLLIPLASQKEHIDRMDEHWSIRSNNTADSLAWGADYFSRKGEQDILASLAFLYHYRKWGQEWHPSAAYRLYNHYGEIYRLLHLAYSLVKREKLPSPDGKTARMLEKLRALFQEQSIGKTGRFLNKGILNSWTFRKVSDHPKSGLKEFERIAKILDLTANYFRDYIKPVHYEQPKHESLSFFR